MELPTYSLMVHLKFQGASRHSFATSAYIRSELHENTFNCWYTREHVMDTFIQQALDNGKPIVLGIEFERHFPAIDGWPESDIVARTLVTGRISSLHFSQWDESATEALFRVKEAVIHTFPVLIAKRKKMLK